MTCLHLINTGIYCYRRLSVGAQLCVPSDDLNVRVYRPTLRQRYFLNVRNLFIYSAL